MQPKISVVQDANNTEKLSMTNTQNVEELQPRMTRETLVSLARKAAVYLPTASAQLMNELATRLDVTSVALCEAMEQRRNIAAENLALRTPENWLKHSETGNAAVAIADGNGETEEASLLAGMKAIIACIESPATEAVLNEVRAAAIPQGFMLVPEQMHIDAKDIESICDRCGNGDQLYGEFTDGILWVGELSNDGVIKYGLNVASADYPDEGSITIY